MRSACVLLAPAPAIGLGLLVATAHGAPWAAYLSNVAAMIVGAVVVVLSSRVSAERLARILPCAAFVAIAATLLFAGLDGVHRWLPVGSLSLNASAAFAPWLLFGVLSESRSARHIALVAAIATQLVHCAQPDAAQATALALGALPIVLDRAVIGRRLGVPIAALLATLAAGTWARVDPLPAVDHVERVLVLAGSSGPLWVLAMIAAGLPLLAPFVAVAAGAPIGVRASGALYFSATLAVTFFGNFPVAIFGAGAGPILGWHAILAVVDASSSERRVSSPVAQ